MSKLHEVTQVDFEDNHLILSVDGETYQFPLEVISPRLAAATDAERRVYQISPSGYGIHWLGIDEDLSINGLLKLAQTHDYQLSQR
jgi:hypothetical protein